MPCGGPGPLCVWILIWKGKQTSPIRLHSGHPGAGTPATSSIPAQTKYRYIFILIDSHWVEWEGSTFLSICVLNNLSLFIILFSKSSLLCFYIYPFIILQQSTFHVRHISCKSTVYLPYSASISSIFCQVLNLYLPYPASLLYYSASMPSILRSFPSIFCMYEFPTIFCIFLSNIQNSLRPFFAFVPSISCICTFQILNLYSLKFSN
jgi:hypothetical protein